MYISCFKNTHSGSIPVAGSRGSAKSLQASLPASGSLPQAAFPLSQWHIGFWLLRYGGGPAGAYTPFLVRLHP